MAEAPSLPPTNIAGFKKLLAIATEAQGEHPLDRSIPPMSHKDTEWLESVLKEVASDSDPVKQLKRQLSRLREAEQGASSASANSSSYASFIDLSEDVRDLVCDMDLALTFCQLGGLTILKSIMDHHRDEYSAVCMSLIGELTQNNPKVQELVLKEELLEKCLDELNNVATASEEMRVKCLAAISGIVKNYIPALVKLIRHGGIESIKRSLDAALVANEARIVRRTAVIASNINASFTPHVSKQMKITELTEVIRTRLRDAIANENTPAELRTVYAESLDYMSE